MDRKIHVAQIIGKCINGGVESFVMNYYKNMDRNLVIFDFYIENESDIINKKVVDKLGGKIFITPKYTNLFKYIIFLRKKFRENNYDIVHSNMNALSIFPLFAAKLAGIKVRIAHSHSTSNKKEIIRSLVKNILKPFSKVFATNYFACSKEAGIWLFGKRFFNEGNVVVINNAIDLDRFRFNMENRISIRKQLGIKDESVVLGSIGRFEHQKNHLFLLKLLNELKDKNNNFKLILIGDGSLKESYLNYIKKHDLSNFVFLLEPCLNIERYYSAFDIFLFPSYYEGLGIVLIEAQANGLPCIISQFIPKTAIISDNVFSESVDNLGTWINLLTSKNLYRKSGQINTSSFDIKEESKKLLKIYINLSKKI